MMTSWGTETFARCVGEAHERDHKHPDAESIDPDKRRYATAAEKMDRYNNETGIQVGLRHEDDTAARCRTRLATTAPCPKSRWQPTRISVSFESCTQAPR
ncbi:hypothetical protein [Nocardia sp. NPDC058480]|uniref:hypothetical protein n=1 Tax=Nocardia sp. NPDC058480 TaxID=3346522 RepID=UPI00364CAEE5